MSPGRVPDGQWPGAPAPELSRPVTRAPKAGGWTPGPTTGHTHPQRSPVHQPRPPGTLHPRAAHRASTARTHARTHARPVRKCRRQRKLWAPCSEVRFTERKDLFKEMYRGNTWEDFQKVGGRGGRLEETSKVTAQKKRRLRQGSGGGRTQRMR